MFRPFKNFLWVGLLGAMVSLSACSSNSVSEDSEEEFVSDEQGEAGTDAAPVEGDQLLAAEDSAEKGTVQSADDEGLDEVAKADAPTLVPPSPQEEVPLSDPMPLADSPSPAAIAETKVETPASSAGVGEVESYSVRSGDTLMRIAFEQFGDLFAWKKIYEANKDVISDPNKIPKGVTLKFEKGMGSSSVVRGDERYMIKVGDTLGTISGDVYGTPKKWKKLYEQNSSWIKDPNRIYAGFFVYYTMTPEERQEADQLKKDKPVPSAAPVAASPASQQRDPAAAAVAPVPGTK